MSSYCVQTWENKILCDQAHVEMASVEKAKSEVLTYLLSVARDEFVVSRDRQELSCVLTGADGKTLLRASLELQIEPL